MWNFNHRNLFPIFKLPHPIINNQQIFVPVYIATDFWFFTATSDMPFQLLSLKVIAASWDENNLSSNL